MADIQAIIDSMSLTEIKQRLAEYMAADEQMTPHPVAVEVRACNTSSSSCCYEVLLIAEDGHESEVKFRDRYTRLIYIYTLMHPMGYQRRLAAANNYQSLRQLYTKLYIRSSNALIKTITRAGFDHFFSHHIARSRLAIRQVTPHASLFAIDRPQSHNGKVLIPFVAQGGTVILDHSLLANNIMNNV